MSSYPPQAGHSVRLAADPRISEYWNHCYKITEADGILLPLKLRLYTLQCIHTGHFGVEKSKHRAKGHNVLASMGRQLEDAVKNCDICRTHQNANRKEPVLSHEISETHGSQ